MPEKEKSVVSKSQSLQEINTECIENRNNDSNIFERQVDGDHHLCCDRTDRDKVKTLPPGTSATRSNGFYFMGKSNQLKRPIVLPRISFVSNKKGRKLRAAVCGTEMSQQGELENDAVPDVHVESDPGTTTAGRSIKKMVKTDSVKNFFVKVVNQISVNTRNRAKESAECEERSKEWRLYFDTGSKVPGVIGIRNHGNTCFINSILQCLSYTDILAEYFVLDQYKHDLKRRRRISAFTRANGTGRGELTEQFATLLKSLWSLQYDPEISDKFKSLVDKYGSQYKGGSQHDAQEFLLWLLDRVHEELNTATKKKYKRLKDLPGRPDDVVAAESLANYTRCNNSFVMDIFQAQFRSSLTCPNCERQSNTFDPFLCVSLPIPQKQIRPFIVTVLYIDQSPRQVRIGLTLPVESEVRDLREMLSRDTGIEPQQLSLVSIDDLCFQASFCDGQPLSVIPTDCSLFAIELPKHPEHEDDDGAFMVLTWINVYREGDKIEKRFGTPYTIQVSRETLYGDLQKLLMKEMSPILHDDILISAQKVPLFKIRVLDGFEGRTYLEPGVEMPLYMECVETALNICQVRAPGCAAHVQLVLEWDMPAKTQVIADDSNPVEEHASVKQVQLSPQEGSSVSLQECFSLYTSEERLGKDDAFFCPQCNKKREVVKKLGVWSIPDVLVVHLKRFRHSTRSSNKLDTMVEFPLENFDMSPNMARAQEVAGPPEQVPGGGQGAANLANGLKVLSAFSPWKHPKRLRLGVGGPGDETTYDLYGVCNHHGTDLQGGHYTAYCRNPTDSQWYFFDDVNTRRISEADIVTKDAYILFYQKSSLAASTSSSASGSSSSSSSSTGSNPDHWVYRMPDFYYKAKNETKCAPAPRTSAKAAAKKVARSKAAADSDKRKVDSSSCGAADAETGAGAAEESFTRNSRKYATMPSKRTSDLITVDTDNYSDTEQAAAESDEDTDTAPSR